MSNAYSLLCLQILPPKLSHPINQYMVEMGRIKSLLPAFGALNERDDEEEDDEEEAEEGEEEVFADEILNHIQPF